MNKMLLDKVYINAKNKVEIIFKKTIYLISLAIKIIILNTSNLKYDYVGKTLILVPMLQ